eukprot:2756143-Amphidinium_carterae.2
MDAVPVSDLVMQAEEAERSREAQSFAADKIEKVIKSAGKENWLRPRFVFSPVSVQFQYNFSTNSEPKTNRKRTENEPKTYPRTENGPKTDRKRTVNWKRTGNEPKMNPKRTENEPKTKWKQT